MTTNLQDALLKAKLVTEKQVKTVRTQKEKEEKKETKKPTPKPSPKLEADEFKKFEELWNNEKSKKFLIHLLHGFMPFSDNYTIFGWEDKTHWKNGKKCCICQLETLSKQDIFEHFDEFAKTSLNSLHLSIKDENFNPSQYMSEEKKKIFGDRLLGVTSEKTECILCSPCYETFANWIQTKLLRDGGFGEFSKIITFVRRSYEHKKKIIKE